MEYVNNSAGKGHTNKGSETKKIVTLAWPIVISMLSFTAMDLADTLFVGWLGTTELAAVGLAATVVFLLQCFFMGSLQGVSIVSSQAVGAEDHGRARRAAVTGLFLAVPAGMLVVSMSLADVYIFAIMGGEAAVQALAGDYFSLRLLGVPFFFVMLAICNHYQGIGDTRTAMKLNLLANGLNIALNPMLIYGIGFFPELGVEGAALATVASQFVGMAAALIHFGLGQKSAVGFDADVARHILHLGLPLGVRYLLGVTGFTVFTAFLARLGTVELAAHQIALRVIAVSFLPGHGIAQAAGILAGQRVGARNFDTIGAVLMAGLRISWALMGALGLVFLLFPEVIAGVFVDDRETIVLAATLLMVGAGFQLLDATVMTLVQTLNGTGDTRFTMIVGVMTTWLIMLPSAWFMAFYLEMGAVGAWLAFLVELPVLSAILVWRFRSNRWRAKATESVDSFSDTSP